MGGELTRHGQAQDEQAKEHPDHEADHDLDPARTHKRFKRVLSRGVRHRGQHGHAKRKGRAQFDAGGHGLFAKQGDQGDNCPDA